MSRSMAYNAQIVQKYHHVSMEAGQKYQQARRQRPRKNLAIPLALVLSQSTDL